MIDIRRLPTMVAVCLVRFYQLVLSPLKVVGCCRFTPTCSEYSRQAFIRFGFCKGLWLTVARLLKCHPFYRGCVYDPVPEKKDKDRV